jgi:hypothetical protein
LNVRWIIRFCLFIGLVGHGLVSLGVGPSYHLHFSLVEALPFGFSPGPFLRIHGCLELCLGVAVCIPQWAKVVLPLFMSYVVVVALVATNFYFTRVGNVFGVAEVFRRMPWFVMGWYLLKPPEDRFFPYLRIGLAFAFLSHGLASVGLFGLNGMHIEIASVLFDDETARKVVTYSGFTDLIIGVSLITRLASTIASVIGAFWLIVVISMSYALAFSDGLFRTSFLVLAFLVAFNPKCHLPWRVS